MKKEAQQLKDSQQNLLFADDKDLAGKLKKVEEEFRDLTNTTNKLKAKAKVRIQELTQQNTDLTNENKKNQGVLEEQTKALEKFKADGLRPRESLADVAIASPGSGWDDEGEGDAEVAPAAPAAIVTVGGSHEVAELKEENARVSKERDSLRSERDSLNDMVGNLSKKVEEKEENLQAQVSEVKKVKEEQARRQTEHEGQILRLMENQSQESGQGDTLLPPFPTSDIHSLNPPYRNKIIAVADKNTEIEELQAQVAEFQKLKTTVESLQQQLLQKDEKYGKLLEEKEDEMARQLQGQQTKFKEASEEREGKLKKLETQLQNTVQL